MILLYLGRLAGLVAWAGLMYAAIRAIPFGKWLLFCLALAPVSITQGTVLSTDAVTNGLSFLIVARVLRRAMASEDVLGWRDVWEIAVLGALLALTKFVYVTLAFSFLAVPFRRAGSSKRFWTMAGVVVAVAAAAWLAWTIPASRLYVPYDRYNELYRDSQPLVAGTDRNAQLAVILEHPLAFVGRTIDSVARDRLWIRFMSWVDWDVVLPEVLASALLWIFLAVALVDGGVPAGPTPWQRAVLLTVALGTVFLFYFLHYLTWTPVGAPYVDGIHGRYAIPVAPAFFLAMSSSRLAVRFQSLRNRLGWVLVPSLLASHVVTVWALLHRYWLA